MTSRSLRPKEKKGRRSAQNISSPTPHFLLAKIEGGVKKKEEEGMSWRFPERSNSLWEKNTQFCGSMEKVLLSFPDFLTLNCFRQKGGKERKLIVSRIFLSKKRAPPSSSSLFPSLIFPPRALSISWQKFNFSFFPSPVVIYGAVVSAKISCFPRKDKGRK